MPLKHNLFFYSVIIFVVFLVGCASQKKENVQPAVTREQTVISTQENLTIPENSPISPVASATPKLNVEPNTASIQGQFFISASHRPLVETAFYLVPGEGEAKTDVPSAFAGEQSDTIQGFTDDQGRFVLTNIAPGTYYMFVWAPLRWVLVLDTRGGETNSLPLKLDLDSNQAVSLGDILLEWP